MEWMESRGIQDLQTIPRMLLQAAVKPGDTVIDATAGRGRDTLYLAQSVGPQGCVYAFDVQDEAIAATRALLARHHVLDRVRLLADCHSRLAQYIRSNVQAAVFNLGYLPGSDHGVVTQPQTTLEALAHILQILAKRGIVVITLYTAHHGGENESDHVKKYCSNLSKKDFSVFQGIYLNQGESSPYWIAIQKNREDTE